jgi:hypothetical protein
LGKWGILSENHNPWKLSIDEEEEEVRSKDP